MRLGVLVAAAALASACVPAFADTFETFDVNATAYAMFFNHLYGQGYTVTGTLTFDTTTSTFTDSDLATSFGPITGGPVYDGTAPFLGSPTSFYFGFGVYPGPGSPGGPYFLLGIPGTSLSGYSGGDICTLTVACSGGQSDLNSAVGYVYYGTSGALTLESSATPEPSAIALLGTGLLGVVGLGRRRWA